MSSIILRKILFVLLNLQGNENVFFVNKLINIDNNQLKFKINVSKGSILYNGTISPIEKNDDLLEIQEIQPIKKERVSSINLDSLGCNYKGEYVNQPVPPVICDYNFNNVSDNVRFAIRIYENDKLKPLYIQWGVEDLKEIMNYELFKNNQKKNIIEFNDYELKLNQKIVINFLIKKKMKIVK